MTGVVVKHTFWTIRYLAALQIRLLLKIEKLNSFIAACFPLNSKRNEHETTWTGFCQSTHHHHRLISLRISSLIHGRRTFERHYLLLLHHTKKIYVAMI